MSRGHTCIITKASHDLLTAQAEAVGRSMKLAERTSDGMYVAWFDDEVWARLHAISDNIDEAIRVICSGQWGQA